MRKALLHLKQSDPVMAAIIKRAGPYRMNYRPPDFAGLARSIVYQQLNGAAASTILARVVAAAGGRLTPQRILRIPDDRLRAAGLSRQKIAYLRDLAEHTRDRRLRFGQLTGLPDDAVIAALTQVKGVGVWTAHMFLMFTLRRHNILPVGDLGVRIAIRKAYGLPELPSPDEMRDLARAWDPYCSIASWYLWRSLEATATKPAASARPSQPLCGQARPGKAKSPLAKSRQAIKSAPQNAQRKMNKKHPAPETRRRATHSKVTKPGN